jgi:hypothetical protein
MLGALLLLSSGVALRSPSAEADADGGNRRRTGRMARTVSESRERA